MRLDYWWLTKNCADYRAELDRERDMGAARGNVEDFDTVRDVARKEVHAARLALTFLDKNCPRALTTGTSPRASGWKRSQQKTADRAETLLTGRAKNCLGRRLRRAHFAPPNSLTAEKANRWARVVEPLERSLKSPTMHDAADLPDHGTRP